MAKAISLKEFEGAERALALLDCYRNAPQLLSIGEVREMAKYIPKITLFQKSDIVERLSSTMKRNY